MRETWVPSSQKPLVLLHASGSDAKVSTYFPRFPSLNANSLCFSQLI